MQRNAYNTLRKAALVAMVSLTTALLSSQTFAVNGNALKRAERALASGEPEQTLNILAHSGVRTGAVERQADAEGLRCRAYIAIGDYADAVTACETAIRLDGSHNSWRFWNNLGAAQLYLDNYEAAQAAFEQAIEVSAWRRHEAPIRNLRVTRHLIDSTPSPAAIAGVTSGAQ